MSPRVGLQRKVFAGSVSPALGTELKLQSRLRNSKLVSDLKSDLVMATSQQHLKL